MIIVKLKGRIGNQLFQVAFSYLLSRRDNHRIIMYPISQYGYQLNYFKIPSLFWFSPIKINTLLYKLIYKIFPNFKILNGDSCLVRHQVPDSQVKNLITEGYFQNGELYLPFKSDFQRIFKLKNKFINLFTQKYGELLKGKLLVINLRLREYSNFYFNEINSTPYLGPEWYYSILDSLCIKDFDYCVVISDDIEHAKEILLNYKINYIFIDDSWFIDFQFLLNGDTLIIPNSSFSWWGAFLNPKVNKTVYAPKNWVGVNAGTEYPSGIMINEFNWV